MPAAHAAGIDSRMMVAGMSAAAVAGVGIGLMLPTAWLKSTGSSDDGSAKRKARPLSAKDSGSKVIGDEGVYEDVQQIAEDIPRPAFIQDMTRDEVDARALFHAQPSEPHVKPAVALSLELDA